jgi:hypothetical protein
LLGRGGGGTTVNVGRILTYICAEAENDTVNRIAPKNNNLIRFFFIVEIFSELKKR